METACPTRRLLRISILLLLAASLISAVLHQPPGK